MATPSQTQYPCAGAAALAQPWMIAEYDIAGLVCETGDSFARARELPECAEGDLLMIRATGAYGASMSSTYNSRPLVAEVLLDRGRYAVIPRRQTFDDMIAGKQPATDWETA